MIVYADSQSYWSGSKGILIGRPVCDFGTGRRWLLRSALRFVWIAISALFVTCPFVFEPETAFAASGHRFAVVECNILDETRRCKLFDMVEGKKKAGQEDATERNVHPSDPKVDYRYFVIDLKHAPTQIRHAARSVLSKGISERGEEILKIRIGLEERDQKTLNTLDRENVGKLKGILSEFPPIIPLTRTQNYALRSPSPVSILFFIETKFLENSVDGIYDSKIIDNRLRLLFDSKVFGSIFGTENQNYRTIDASDGSSGRGEGGETPIPTKYYISFKFAGVSKHQNFIENLRKHLSEEDLTRLGSEFPQVKNVLYYDPFPQAGGEIPSKGAPMDGKNDFELTIHIGVRDSIITQNPTFLHANGLLRAIFPEASKRMGNTKEPCHFKGLVKGGTRYEFVCNLSEYAKENGYRNVHDLVDQEFSVQHFASGSAINSVHKEIFEHYNYSENLSGQIQGGTLELKIRPFRKIYRYCYEKEGVSHAKLVKFDGDRAEASVTLRNVGSDDHRSLVVEDVDSFNGVILEWLTGYAYMYSAERLDLEISLEKLSDALYENINNENIEYFKVGRKVFKLDLYIDKQSGYFVLLYTCRSRDSNPEAAAAPVGQGAASQGSENVNNGTPKPRDPVMRRRPAGLPFITGRSPFDAAERVAPAVPPALSDFVDVEFAAGWDPGDLLALQPGLKESFMPASCQSVGQDTLVLRCRLAVARETLVSKLNKFNSGDGVYGFKLKSIDSTGEPERLTIRPRGLVLYPGVDLADCGGTLKPTGLAKQGALKLNGRRVRLATKEAATTDVRAMVAQGQLLSPREMNRSDFIELITKAMEKDGLAELNRGFAEELGVRIGAPKLIGDGGTGDHFYAAIPIYPADVSYGLKLLTSNASEMQRLLYQADFDGHKFQVDPRARGGKRRTQGQGAPTLTGAELEKGAWQVRVCGTGHALEKPSDPLKKFKVTRNAAGGGWAAEPVYAWNKAQVRFFSRRFGSEERLPARYASGRLPAKVLFASEVQGRESVEIPVTADSNGGHHAAFHWRRPFGNNELGQAVGTIGDKTFEFNAGHYGSLAAGMLLDRNGGKLAAIARDPDGSVFDAATPADINLDYLAREPARRVLMVYFPVSFGASSPRSFLRYDGIEEEEKDKNKNRRRRQVSNYLDFLLLDDVLPGAETAGYTSINVILGKNAKLTFQYPRDRRKIKENIDLSINELNALSESNSREYHWSDVRFMQDYDRLISKTSYKVDIIVLGNYGDVQEIDNNIGDILNHRSVYLINLSKFGLEDDVASILKQKYSNLKVVDLKVNFGQDRAVDNISTMLQDALDWSRIRAFFDDRRW